MDNRQQKGTQTPKEKATAEKLRINKEIQFLQSLKRVFDTKDGEAVINWILKYTNPLASPVDNSGKIGFRLGIQEVGKKLTIKLINSGCDLQITDFVEGIEKDKLSQLHNELNKINEEVK